MVEPDALGYNVYMVAFTLANLSKDKENKLNKYILGNEKVRYAFMSASQPVLCAYVTVKYADELDDFINGAKKIARNEIIGQRYLRLKLMHHKYERIPTL